MELNRQRSSAQAAWERLCRNVPYQAGKIRKRLTYAARMAQQREAIRSAATRVVGVVRTFALRAGIMLGIGDQIFFLTIDEVLAALRGDGSACQYIPVRQQVHKQYCALPPYPVLICGRFDPFAWATDPNRRSDRFAGGAHPVPPATDDPGMITGAPGALGVVEGPVRRLDRLEDSSCLQAGEVLVTTMTNIGWTPLFPRAAAIVTDLGAPLSHAAIVARELGIPAVVGCGDATARLKTGDRVRVDGGSGVVTILCMR